MTCIVGLIENGKVYIGADSAAATSSYIDRIQIDKVFRVDDYVIAYTTSFRMGQLLQYKIKLPEAPENPTMKFMVSEFIEIIREGFKSHGYSEINSNAESGGAFIVGVKGRLFQVESDFQVQEIKNGFCANGSGMYYAIGAMEALEGHKPIERIQKSIQISAKYNPFVTEPIKIIEV